ncbi:hypothetical protein [Thioalkalivibrio sp. HK1]|uniref:hypothetical protein n=1 Tax=Thioalkalivibrio sp. HK1 TaxID=1469245 RepID=UPI0012DE9C72|nr:hypothetical protein [Thioalkalivibrio sp. HK1]
MLSKTIQQIVIMAGDGNLGDGTQSSKELREFLKAIDTKYLKIYANQCLENGFSGSGFVIQDIVNEIGRRMGFGIQYGNYQEKMEYGHDNADGIWIGDGWSFIVEVNDKDCNSIEFDKIASWRNDYSNIDDQNTTCLIVVGRQDTTALENQLRGSRHHWNMRIVGFESLYKALEFIENSENEYLKSKIVDLFKPREFTLIDRILSVAFDFFKGRDEPIKKRIAKRDMNEERNKKHHKIDSDKEGIKIFKMDIARRIEKKYGISLIRKRRSLFETNPDGTRFFISVSKLYESGLNQYWYTYNTDQMRLLEEADNAFYIIGCLDNRKSFLLPVSYINNLTKDMHSSKYPDGGEGFHIRLRREGERYVIYTVKNRKENDIGEFEL